MDSAGFPTGDAMKFFNLHINSVLFVVISMLCHNGYTLEILSDRLDLDCNQSDSFILACSYRPLLEERITGITAMLGSNSLEVSTTISYPEADSITAILFLVDTSDPGRQVVITKNATQIEKMLNAIQRHHVFGLANFDKELNILVPLGKEKDQVISVANSMKASGLTTELYRNTIRSIEYLSRANADRKLLFLFSDGQAEDKAYFHEDVVNVSRKNGVVINSLGYPRSTPLSVALQTLRRISEETGGVYIETGANFELPESFISRPYSNIDRGGHFIINLGDTTANSPDNPEVELRFETVNGNFPFFIPVSLPRTAAVLPQPAMILPPQLPEQVQAELPIPLQGSGYVDFLFWYGIPISLVIILILTLLTLYLLFGNKKAAVSTNKVAYAEIKPLAYLITQDENAKRYSVTSTTWRIGRSQDNEMTILDDSISRRHAEIQRETDGQFVVYDRDSTNGVYVNNFKITKHLLSEGDIIEIGDVNLRFTQNPLDYQLADDTAMLNTRMPDFN